MSCQHYDSKTGMCNHNLNRVQCPETCAKLCHENRCPDRPRTVNPLQGLNSRSPVQPKCGKPGLLTDACNTPAAYNDTNRTTGPNYYYPTPQPTGNEQQWSYNYQYPWQGTTYVYTRQYKCPRCGGEFNYWLEVDDPKGSGFKPKKKVCPFCGLVQGKWRKPPKLNIQGPPPQSKKRGKKQ